MTILYCGSCSQAWRSHGTVPYYCPSCRKHTNWTTQPPGSPPKPYQLTANDRRLLKRLVIAADDPIAVEG